MTKPILTTLALAALVAGPAIAPLHAAGSNAGFVTAQSAPAPKDCSKIEDAQLRAECLQTQGKGN